jgi:hypothetical protein
MRALHIVLATALGTLAATAACSNLLDVDNPGRVPVESLSDPSMAPVLDASALGSFVRVRIRAVRGDRRCVVG